ncbi:MAG TPA: hypothetical protein VMT00_05005 [Thermoanaerobaculia bacterium]|nr:hypothetical protein [Thermoanaerobaculia bacterium]
MLRLSKIVAVIALNAAVVASIHDLCVVPLRCNIDAKNHQEETIRLLDTADPVRRAMRARTTLDNVRAAQTECRTSLDLVMIEAANLRALNRNLEAIDAYRRALRLAQRPEIYFNLGETQAVEGESSGAVASLAEACRFDPRYCDAIADSTLRDEVKRRLR